MDMSVLYFALPLLSSELAPTATQTLWIMDIYGFLLAGLLITMGTLGDRIGRRRLLMIGAAAFGLASAVAAYSSSAQELIAARALLGVAGATTALPGVPPELAQTARETLAGAAAVAEQISGSLGGPLLEAASAAFVSGLRARPSRPPPSWRWSPSRPPSCCGTYAPTARPSGEGAGVSGCRVVTWLCDEGSGMTLTAEDRTAITELISLHGHLVDGGELDRLDELYTADIRYDVSELGGGTIRGLAALKEAALTLGEANPVGHHVTNIVLTGLPDGTVRGMSKGIGIHADGTCASVTYEDVIARGDRGWRITHRRVVPRRVPLGGR